MLVIGNGESRKDIDIDKLSGPKVGCNAIIRDWFVDRLVCVDTRVVDEVISSSNKQPLIYTRSMWISRYEKNQNVRTLPDLPYKSNQKWDDPFNWGSGPYATLVAATYTTDYKIKMLGFDLYGNDRHLNNIYKDTMNYKGAGHAAVDPSYWIYQIGMLFRCFPKIEFTIYQKDDWKLPLAWTAPNIVVDKLSKIS
jgi:hypothetical protein